MLTVVGCGGSETGKRFDGGGEAGFTPPPKAQLNANPGTVTVGTVDVGSTSTPQLVSVTNTGGQTATLTVTTAPVGVIAATGCAGTLAPGASCVLTITATPTVAGAISGSVAVAAANANTVVISVTGNAIPPGNFTVEPTAIDLGPLAVGQVAPASVTVTAQANLTGLSTGVRGTDVRIDTTTSTCGTTLAAGQSCTVVARFTASAAGASAGNSIVVSQGARTVVVPITANVLTAAKLAATPTTASLTAAVGQQSQPVTINIGNTGGMPTGQLAVAITGASFKVVSETCSIVTLAAGATCSVVVAYAPAAGAAATEQGTLTVTDRGVGASVATAALTGTLITSATLTLTGGPDLGSVAPGAIGAEVVFTVTNTSATPSGALTAAVTPPANITISSNTCATKATLALNETCTIGLRLTPAAGAPPASIAAILTVTGASGSVSVQVTGAIVTGPVLSAAPPSINFGSVFVNQASAAKTVTVTNIGATTTGVLTVNLTGAGAAQVALTGNTCTVALAPAQSCTITAVYSPTDTTGVSGAIGVTDGVVSTSVAMVGTGLTATNFFACKDLPNGTLAQDSTTCGLFGEVLASQLDMGAQTVGYTTGNAVGAVLVEGQNDQYTLRVVVPAAAPTDSGAITVALSGTNAADFKVVNNMCTAALNPGGNCTMDLNFTPAATGDRTATLTINGAKGGIWTVALKGTGLALLSLEPTPEPTPPATGLDFGQQPNGTAGRLLHFLATVRGATSPAATTTTVNVVLTTGVTPDFRNVLAGGTPTEVNRCDGAALGLTANTGRASATVSGNWTATVGGYWTCDFWIQFYPQTGKSETPKTATVDATATAGGSATLALTGTSTGPLVFDPGEYTFSQLIPGQASEMSTIVNYTLTVNGDPDGGVGGQTAEFTLVNKGPAGVDQGPVTIALDNTADFGIVADGCTMLSHQLAPTTVTEAPYPEASSCVVKVIFVQPANATPGTKTATLTATAASGETAKAKITGIVSQALNVDVSPKPAGTPPVVDVGSAPQDNSAAWFSFTISNPAGAARSGKLSYSVTTDGVTAPDGDFELYTLATAGVTAYPTGFCGDSFTKQLGAGETCVIQVRFAPKNTRGVGVKTGVLWVSNGAAALPKIPLQGTATSQLTATPVDFAFGQVAQGASKTLSTTITNNGKHQLAFTVPNINNPAASAPVSIGDDSQCTALTTLPALGTCRLDYVWTAGAEDIADPVDPTEPLVVTLFEGTTEPESHVTLDLNLSGQVASPPALALYGFSDYANDGSMTPQPAAPAAGGELTPLVLGDQLTGSSSNPFGVWFTNTGDVDATGVVAELTGTNAADFKIATELTTLPLCATTLKAKAKCVVPVRLAPGTSGRGKTADLTLKAGSLASVTVHLYGNGHGQGDAVPGVYAQAVGSTSTVGTTGPTAVGGSSKVYFTLSNSSGGDLTFANLVVNGSGSFTGPTAEATGGGTACGATIINTAQCQFSVTFAPTSYGDNSTDAQRYRWAFVTYGPDAAGHPTAIASVLGTVQKPAKLQLSAASTATVKVTLDGANSIADFGQVLQQHNGTLAFTITNVGEAATAGAVTPTITNGVDYASVPPATNGCASVETLPAAGTCQFTVSVGGSTLGLRESAWLQAVGTAASEDSDEEFLLRERLVQAAVIGTEADITALGSAYAGDTGGCATITVQNGIEGEDHDNRQDTGVLAVSIEGPGAASFTIDRDDSSCYDTKTAKWLSLPLDGDDEETCTVVVCFTPDSAGAKAASVVIGATPGGTPEPISLTGTGVSDLTIDPAGTSAARYAMTSSIQTFVVTNRGPDPTGMLRASVQGANFVIVYDSCFGQSLGYGYSCTVDLAFTGTVSTTTAANATLSVTDGTANNTVASYIKVGGP